MQWGEERDVLEDDVAVVTNVVCLESGRFVKSCCVLHFVYPYIYILLKT